MLGVVPNAISLVILSAAKDLCSLSRSPVSWFVEMKRVLWRVTGEGEKCIGPSAQRARLRMTIECGGMNAERSGKTLKTSYD